MCVVDIRMFADLNVLETVIRSVRFLTFTAEEFVKHVTISELLSPEEKLSILSYLVTEQSPLQLPAKFCQEGERVMENQMK